MGKHAVPSGLIKREKCKCGLWYFPVLIGSSGKISNACSVCKPEQYREEEVKK